MRLTMSGAEVRTHLAGDLVGHLGPQVHKVLTAILVADAETGHVLGLAMRGAIFSSSGGQFRLVLRDDDVGHGDRHASERAATVEVTTVGLEGVERGAHGDLS